MYNSTERKKIWAILTPLFLSIVIAIVLEVLPTGNSSATNTANTGMDTEFSEDKSSSDDTGNSLLADAPNTALPAQPAQTETAAPPQKAPEQDHVFTLTFLGTCAPGSPLGTYSYGSFNAMLRDRGAAYFFNEIAGLLAEDDISIATNACVFTDTSIHSDSLECAADAENTDVYASGSVDFVSLANPNLNDYSATALEDTKAALDARNIRYAESGELTMLEKNGMQIALFCTQLEKNLNTAGDIAAIQNAKDNADYVIVYFWGGENGSHTPEEWLSAVLRSFADAGASLIVGCGNGVLRPVEQYNGSTIVYSLGSLIDGASVRPENASALLRLRITKDEIAGFNAEMEWIPCYSYSSPWQPCVMPDGPDEDQVIGFLSGTATSPVSE